MTNFHRVSTICFYALFLLGATAVAQEKTVGSVSLGQDVLSVTPIVPYGELRITVAGKGVYLQERFSPNEGTALYFDQLLDGEYKYEIIASPDMGQAFREENVATEDPALEREERARTHVQFGSFTVEDGTPKLPFRPVEVETTDSPANEP